MQVYFHMKTADWYQQMNNGTYVMYCENKLLDDIELAETKCGQDVVYYTRHMSAVELYDCFMAHQHKWLYSAING